MAIALAASSKLVRLRAQPSQRAHRDVAEQQLLGSLAVPAAHPLREPAAAKLALAGFLPLRTCWRTTDPKP